MDDNPTGFEDLFAILDADELPGWSVGSSEGGWASQEEIRRRWGEIAVKAAIGSTPVVVSHQEGEEE
jgi:hypothetical protein